VLSPLLGAAVSWPAEWLVRPWLQLDVGAAFTGPLLRPMFRAGIGADFRISDALTPAPVDRWPAAEHRALYLPSLAFGSRSGIRCNDRVDTFDSQNACTLAEQASVLETDNYCEMLRKNTSLTSCPEGAPTRKRPRS
jgi:hypothetical protein